MIPDSSTPCDKNDLEFGIRYLFWENILVSIQVVGSFMVEKQIVQR